MKISLYLCIMKQKKPRTYIRCKSDSPPFQIRFKSVPYIGDIKLLLHPTLVATRYQEKRKEPTPMAIRTSSFLAIKALYGSYGFFSSTGSCISFFDS